jgi:hypothetical protein
VLVQNAEKGSQYTWEVDTAQNRYYIMKDLLEEFQNTGERPTQFDKD